jgi:mannose-6-phosphate isomerase-like protein (cupin superfamily)
MASPELRRFKDGRNVFRRYGWPRSEEYPLVAAYPELRGTNFTWHISVIGRGGSRPLHRTNADHLVLVLDGEMEFEFPDPEGTATFRMEKYDALLIPADVNFRFRQVGFTDATFSATVVRTDKWPHTSEGYEQDP